VPGDEGGRRKGRLGFHGAAGPPKPGDELGCRLAASHLMVRGGVRPPILVGADRARLEECLQAAFRLSTEPLVALLEEASERALDVAIQALDRAGG